VATFLEARFGDEERVVFEREGKKEYFDRISSLPAIYVLQVSARKKSRDIVQRKSRSQAISRLQNSRFALGPTASVQGELLVNGSRIDSLRSETYVGAFSPSSRTTVDLHDYLIFLDSSTRTIIWSLRLFPRLGKGGYSNFLEWRRIFVTLMRNQSLSTGKCHGRRACGGAGFAIFCAA